ncbi:response regulator [Candidatus Woesebacteria bacterium]|nr:response regulator [Candidatus Woesebacteria bacterium]MCD8507784.1 response regulator [Candidatus Woesebacteria bacterium]MCD8526971.1 response regulator [Candidatus Woesebacteria bacterium]MCD8545858.1 response regulator [Candidatus Woesebacteria bacterium]
MSAKTKIVLVVEDERPLLDAIKLKLENSGMEAVTARTVKQALSYLEELPTVDGIWVDHYLLGDEDGLDFVAQVKNEGSRWNQIPVFVVSNTASSEKVMAYMQFGVSKYFVKANYRLDQIIKEIKENLDHEQFE